VSAQECAASASSDADPVTTAAIDFATPTRTLAPKAIHTVLALADTPERDTRESEARRSDSPTRGSSSAAGLTAEVSRTTSAGRTRSRPPAHRAVIDECERLGLERAGPRWEIYGHVNEPGDEEVEIDYLVR
jgi:hypothetical protein